jgi:hypothetical protein
LYPVNEGTQQIAICESANNYALRAAFEPKEYSNAEAVLNALISVEQLDNEENPLESVHQNLRAIC